MSLNPKESFTLFRFNAMKALAEGEHELGILNSLVVKEKASVDVGANIGIYTYFLSKFSKHVYAYEPHPVLANYLTTVAPSNVSVHPCALSNKTFESFLHVPLFENGNENVWLSSIERSTNYEHKYSISIVKLDDQSHRDIGFIKIDVEGHELYVIDGAVNTILRDRPVLLVEIEQRYIKQSIFTVFEYIASIGYEGYFLMNGCLVSLDRFSLEEHQNVERRNTEVNYRYVNNFIFKPLVPS